MIRFTSAIVVVPIMLLVSIVLSCGNSTVATDPCAGAEPVKARFTIYERVGWSGSKSIGDTIGTYVAFFSADERYDSYEWTVGEDDRTWTDSSFSLRFGVKDAGIPIQVRLIARRSPNLECTPSDDGIDTSFRTLLPVSIRKIPILGEYMGWHVEEPQDTFRVNIYWRDQYSLIIDNINRGCGDTALKGIANVSKEFGARVIEFDAGGMYDRFGCKAPKGVARLIGQDSIRIEYVYDRARIPRTFVGRRVK